MVKSESRVSKRVLSISPELLLSWFKTGAIHFPHCKVVDGLPEDVKLIDVRYGWNGKIDLLLQSSQWEETEDRSCPPAQVIFKRVESNQE